MAMLSAHPAGVLAQTPTTDAVVPVTDAMLQNPSPDDWLMWRRGQQHLRLRPAGPRLTDDFPPET
jgi:hypothetical protein